MYVTNWLGNSVSIVETASLTVESTIALVDSTYPMSTAVGADGDALHVVKEGPDTLVSIDLSTQTQTCAPIALGRIHPQVR